MNTTKTVLVTLLAFVAWLVCWSLILNDPPKGDLAQQIRYNINLDNNRAAENLLLQQLRTDSLNLDLNYSYIHNHYRIPKEQRIGKNHVIYRDDDSIHSRYEALTTAKEGVRRDLGYYGLGLCYMSEESRSKAYTCFMQVTNRRMKYLQNSLGYYFNVLESDSAEQYFRREIASNGNVAGATDNLADFYVRKHAARGLASLCSNPVTKPYLTAQHLRLYAYFEGRYADYFNQLFVGCAKTVDVYGLIAALMISMIWLVYLKKIDIFEPEKWRYLVLQFAIAALLTPLSSILYDWLQYGLCFRLDGNWLNDLTYCVFGIGLVEESIKLLAFLLFVSVARKQLNEPVDYLIYAAVAGLGFAFVENLLYFDTQGYQMIHGRAVSSCVAHMALCSMVAYGYVVAKYRRNVYALLYIGVGLLVAALYHGLYDFWIMSDAVQSFSVVSLVVMVSMLFVQSQMYTNAFNISPYFSKKVVPDSGKMIRFLFVGFMAVLAFEHLTVAIHYGPSLAVRAVLLSLWGGSYLMFLILMFQTGFTLRKGVWKALEIWNSKK